MKLVAIQENRSSMLELLLLADPSEEMVMEYLEKGMLFSLVDGSDNAIGAIHLLPIDQETIEIKNIAVKESHHNRGYGKILVQHAIEQARIAGYRNMIVGTGNSSIGNLAFYQKAGFRLTRIIPDFFVENYAEPIFENGIQCRDMLIFEQRLQP